MDRFALDSRSDKTVTLYVSSLLGGFLTDKERIIALQWGEWFVWVALAVLAFVRRECVTAWGHFYNAGCSPYSAPGEWRWPTDEAIAEPIVERPKLTLQSVLVFQPTELLSVEDGDYRAYYGAECMEWMEDRLKIASGVDFSEGKNNNPAPTDGIKNMVPSRVAKSSTRKTVAQLKEGAKEVWTCGVDKLTLKWDRKREMFSVSGKVGGKEILGRFDRIKDARDFLKKSIAE